MNTIFTRKRVGYAGMVGIVLVSLYLLYTVGMDFYLYDIEYSDGSDDARWTVPKERWDPENTIGLLGWGFYLLVTGTHLFLYFKRLSSMKPFNVWALPTFNIKGVRVLSGIFSAVFIFIVFIFDITMPEVYTPSITYAEYKEMPYYDGVDSFWAPVIFRQYLKFTCLAALHLFLYMMICLIKNIIGRCKKRHRNETKNE